MECTISDETDFDGNVICDEVTDVWKFVISTFSVHYWGGLCFVTRDWTKRCKNHSIYRVIQEESAILWEMIVCVILSKKVHMNTGPILNSYRDYGKKKIRNILRARTAIT